MLLTVSAVVVVDRVLAEGDKTICGGVVNGLGVGGSGIIGDNALRD
jgi:hypothetical protein